MVGDRCRARAGAHGGGAEGSGGRRVLRVGPGQRPDPPLGAGAVGSSVVRRPRASMGRVMAERALTARSPLSERAPEVIRHLKEAYPNATVALEFSNPLECLIAVILSAQSTDKKVNEVTEMLFRKYRTPEDYLRVPESEVAVDTHVRRVSQRLGFTDQKDPNKIERDLMAILPREDWFGFTYVLIDHGRAICKAPTPHCQECPVNHLCPSSRV